MTPLLIGAEGSGLEFYTEEEKRLSMETGFVLSEPVLAERLEVSKEEYLESEVHLRLVQTRIDRVLVQYPEFSFDSSYMDVTADTISEVRDKFNLLREDNLDVEQDLIDSEKYFHPQKAINVHFSQLLSFMYAYIQAIEVYSNRKIELDLILNTLPAILNDEFGNLTGIEDVPRLFMEGVGKGVGFITAGVTSFASDIFGGIVEGLGLKLDKSTLIKIGIGIAVVVVLIVVGLIGFQYSKTYISEKARKKASK